MGQRDEKDKMKTRKEKLAGYFFDLSKLIFTAMVLGGMSHYCILCKQNFKVLIIWKD